ncbi:MAG: YgiT-type zinc finger protein [Anaerolineales bacterium]
MTTLYDIPVEVCLECGMIYYDAAVLKEIERRFFGILSILPTRAHPLGNARYDFASTLSPLHARRSTAGNNNPPTSLTSQRESNCAQSP